MSQVGLSRVSRVSRVWVRRVLLSRVSKVVGLISLRLVKFTRLVKYGLVGGSMVGVSSEGRVVFQLFIGKENDVTAAFCWFLGTVSCSC